MSQDFNQPTQPQYSAPQEPRRNNTTIYWVVIVLLLCICIYMFVSRRNLSQQNEQNLAQMAISDSSRQTLETDYNASLARLDQLTSKNSQMDSMINSKDGEITKMKQQIQSILSNSKSTAADLRHAKDLINQLNSKVKSYEERIAELEGQNTTLTNQNSSLTQERDSTVSKNIALKQLGSVLHASNIRMVPMHLKKGKEKETEKAKKVDAFRITFDIDENRIAESGTKQIYLRIVGPDGNLLSNGAYGSGVTSIADNKQLNYTLIKEVALQQNEPVKDVTVDWRQDSDYKKGVYQIELYNSGYKIGGGSVTLK